MKKTLAIILALSVTPAIAAENDGLYIGVKSGSLDIDASGLDADTPKGVVLGYQSGVLGVEFEANFADIDYEFFGNRGSFDYKTLALYGVYRSEGDFYLKAKAGIINQEIKSSFFKEDDTGFSAGIGAGARLGSVSLEAEYTVLDSDVNFFSIGANFHF